MEGLGTLPEVRRLFVIGVVAWGLLAASCGDGPDVPEPTATPETTPETVPGLPVLGQAAQDLTFSGIVEGQMTYATVNCAWIRGSTPEKGRFQAAIEGSVGGKNHRLRIVINGYTGPGPYSWDGVEGSGPEVTVELDGKEKGHATINVDNPGGSGDIEGIFTSPNVGRVAGVWECPGTPR